MLKFRLEIECENDAFQPDPAKELRKLLVDVVTALRHKTLKSHGTGQQTRLRIMDTNGNAVGFVKFVEEDT